MIYSYNTLGFYKTKANRQYDNTGNLRVLHHFETNKIPTFQLITDETISDSNFQYTLYDIDDNVISTASRTIASDTNYSNTTYYRLIFLGATISGQDDGFYYLKIEYDSTTLYSDVFCWQTDVSDYLKIEATSTDIGIGEFDLNMSGFTYTVYLDAKNSLFDYEISEEGVEKSYGNLPLFNSRNKINEFEITGYRVTQDFLSGLRTLWTNGTVTLTYKGDEFDIYDIEPVEKKENYSYSDILILLLKFKRKDYLRTINSI